MRVRLGLGLTVSLYICLGVLCNPFMAGDAGTDRRPALDCAASNRYRLVRARTQPSPPERRSRLPGRLTKKNFVLSFLTDPISLRNRVNPSTSSLGSSFPIWEFTACPQVMTRNYHPVCIARPRKTYLEDINPLWREQLSLGRSGSL